MNISKFDLNKKIARKVSNYQKNKSLEDMNKFNKKDDTKITLLNVDSRHRNKSPKNIIKSLSISLSNPITVTKDSYSIKIYYPNHKLLTGDQVVIQNISGVSKTMGLFFLNSVSSISDFVKSSSARFNLSRIKSFDLSANIFC